MQRILLFALVAALVASFYVLEGRRARSAASSPALRELEISPAPLPIESVTL